MRALGKVELGRGADTLFREDDLLLTEGEIVALEARVGDREVLKDLPVRAGRLRADRFRRIEHDLEAPVAVDLAVELDLGAAQPERVRADVVPERAVAAARRRVRRVVEDVPGLQEEAELQLAFTADLERGRQAARGCRLRRRTAVAGAVVLEVVAVDRR